MSDFRDLVDLAVDKLGGHVLWASDDFFAGKENLLKSTAAVFLEHEYTDRGKWMDGWESLRKRAVGRDIRDEAIIRLGVPGIVRGVVVDTSFFRGNFPEAFELEACQMRSDTSVEVLQSSATEWVKLEPRTPIEGNTLNFFDVSSEFIATHLRLIIYPDGGVARLRVHGTVAPDWRALGGAKNEIDLAALESGGEVLSCSDMFFGPKHNLIAPGRAANMSDGWETKRRRGVNAETHDWAVVKLAGEGTIERIEIDTNHFKGNFPDTAAIDGGATADGPWVVVVPRVKLMAHTRHVFAEELSLHGPFTHVRMRVFPDGGVSRLRVFGRLNEVGKADALARHVNGLGQRALEGHLRACCAANAWVRAMSRSRPFTSGSQLLEIADATWKALPREAWLEAFAAHPRIGETKASTQRETKWSASEQGTARRASSQTLSSVAIANAQYEEKFGWVFLINATGKTGADILHVMRSRLHNTPQAELSVAAEELRQIMNLRLLKLIGG